MQGNVPTDLSFGRDVRRYPGWYTGRAVHIHVKVHVGGNVVHTGQLFFNDSFTDKVFVSTAPYDTRGHAHADSGDNIYAGGGPSTVLNVKRARNKKGKKKKGYEAKTRSGSTPNQAKPGRVEEPCPRPPRRGSARDVGRGAAQPVELVGAVEALAHRDAQQPVDELERELVHRPRGEPVDELGREQLAQPCLVLARTRPDAVALVDRRALEHDLLVAGEVEPEDVDAADPALVVAQELAYECRRLAGSAPARR